ncbi:hypothetical protein EYB33_14695 [Lysinibacillus sphaericus]|uniref:hypothetical protein n=1 Tax=Lysinibacillus sphaericus TaxID=1421 RepID=UPI001E5012C0|nr:hypothetical protein [Lysinibacillus sphaericus]UDK97479.1 hypothetical protein EYB33_14695 [Lysinibacillus sphaericus]
MVEKQIDILQKYSKEIEDIRYLLKNLKEGRIYAPGVYSSAPMDGNLETNIINLEKQLSELIKKIEYNLPSINDNLDDIFK